LYSPLWIEFAYVMFSKQVPLYHATEQNQMYGAIGGLVT